MTYDCSPYSDANAIRLEVVMRNAKRDALANDGRDLMGAVLPCGRNPARQRVEQWEFGETI